MFALLKGGAFMKSEKSVKATKAAPENKAFSLNDDRRVKTLSPGALVAKRFFRNSLAVTGLIFIFAMFVFSFVGGLLSPYGEDEKFYRVDLQNKDYAGVTENKEFRYYAKDTVKYNGVVQAQSLLAIIRGQSDFKYNNISYTVNQDGNDLYSVYTDGELIGIAAKELVNASNDGDKFEFDFTYAALEAKGSGLVGEFTVGNKAYTIDEDGIVFDGGKEIAYVSNYIVRAVMPDVFLSREFKNELIDSIKSGADKFVYKNEDGTESEYILEYDASHLIWDIKQETETRVYDSYAQPSSKHWLGTDRNGMDMLTRLMYGGRVSLIIGFIVVFIETFLGVIMGGISGYFGGWVDNLIMRIVDVFYCIPSMPIIIILGAAMDAANVATHIRMLYLMLILGFLGWPGIARLVRGQILSLREQEFMTATEACGIRASRRIFKHLIPNVVPQLIVTCTMGLGSTIITEATLSFLGLGVRFPYASWGNIINDVNNTFVLTNYWFIWIPAGCCLLLTVLAFNLIGDGLRDAFDPKMKR